MKAIAMAGLAALLLLGREPAEGGLLIHDSFDYPAGDLAGTGGSGWTGPWEGSNPVAAISSGLTYADMIGNTLATSGAALDTGDGDAVTTISSRETGARNGGLWISVLIQPQNSSGDFVGVSFYQGGLANADARFAIEHAGGKNLRLTRRGGGTAHSEPYQTTIGETVLAVIHLVPGGGGGDPALDRIDVFFDPVLGEEPGFPHASLEIGGLQFDRVRIAAQNGRSSLVDELRVGDTYADVTPYTPAADPDHDGDGLTDSQEAELGLDPFFPDTQFIAAVKANPALFGLHSRDEILDLKLRRPVISVSGASVGYSLDLARRDGAVLETIQAPVPSPPSRLFLRLYLDTP